jgi:hypothetical protein
MLLKEGRTSLKGLAGEAATGACKKNIGNALSEQRGHSAVVGALMMSAKDSYDKSGVVSASSYREIGVESAAKRRKVNDEELHKPSSVACLQEPPEERNVAVNQCVICMEAEKNIKFAPCNHIACCGDCAKHCDVCPLCRARPTSSERVFL